MATSDTELVQEARAITDYDASILSDSEFHSLVRIGKEEIRAEFDSPNFSFYQTGEEHTLQADRALFWFTCIAAKIRAGEIAGLDIDIGQIRTSQPDQERYQPWFRQLNKRLNAATSKHSEASGISQQAPQRDDRQYGESFDTSVREPEV